MKYFGFVLIILLFFSVSAREFDVGVNVFTGEPEYFPGIEVNPTIVKASTDDGDGKIMVPIIILSAMDKRQNIMIEVDSSFIFINNHEIILEPDATEVLNFLLISENVGVNIGKITFISELGRVVVPVIFEVQNSLFDANVEIPPAFSSVEAGDNFKFITTIYNLESLDERVDVKFVAESLDTGTIVYSESQILDVGINSFVEIEKSFKLPEDAAGEYVLSVITEKGEFLGSDVSLFSVVPSVYFTPEEKDSNDFSLIISTGIIVVLIFSFLVINFYWNKRIITSESYWSKQVADLRKTKFNDAAKDIRRLKRKKYLLKNAFDKGYVKRASYEEGRKEINKIIRNLERKI